MCTEIKEENASESLLLNIYMRPAKSCIIAFKYFFNNMKLYFRFIIYFWRMSDSLFRIAHKKELRTKSWTENGVCEH